MDVGGLLAIFIFGVVIEMNFMSQKLDFDLCLVALL